MIRDGTRGGGIVDHGLRGGLRDPIRTSASATGGGGGSSWVASVFLGNTLAAAPAVTGAPVGSTYLNASDIYPTTRAGLTMGTPASPTASDTNGGDGFGYFYFAGGAEAFQIALPNGTYTVYGLFGNVLGDYHADCKIWDGAAGSGTLRFTMATVTVPGGSHGDFNGAFFVDGPTAFAGMTGQSIVISSGMMTIATGTVDCFANWFGVHS